ncbi:SHOCT domain-containing protein [uncultured Tateyamaria sp.]|uniref:SHOCT domain-containing protein n=1 Tax=uncultured Tateyamaria sp. TaxID=455651 RepID=UPI0026137E0E|nr:SHOCT domain-containing protein [uncultured Tateyamaria sp.]
MTAILDDIRRLDAAHARGEINAVDLAAAKSKLFEAVPDADEITVHATARTVPRRPPAARLGPTLLLCIFVLTLCAGSTLLLTGDLMLAMTLSITVLAALTVTLFRQLDG